MSDNTGQRIIAPEAEIKSNKSKKAVKSPTEPRKKKESKAGVLRKTLPKSFSEILCPECGKGHLIKGRTAVGCDAFREGCRFVVPFAILGADITAETVTVKHILSFLGKKK